jgi:hypothetical protein
MGKRGALRVFAALIIALAVNPFSFNNPHEVYADAKR